MRAWWVFVLSAIVVLSAASISKDNKYRYDSPAEVRDAPGTRSWSVGLLRSESGYRVVSITKLNGSLSVQNEPDTFIASGTAGNWSWEILSVPSLLPSWKAWQSNNKIQLRSQDPDAWSHSAATWGQAFTRAHAVATYLLGREPLPLRISLLLIPEDTAYNEEFTQSDENFVPLTFAFYYPLTSSDDDKETNSRFLALVNAVATSMHEYQHVLNRVQITKAAGRGKTDKAINDEIRSNCWYKTTLLALTSGTHSEINWDPLIPRQQLLKSLDRDPQKTRTPAEADEFRRDDPKRHFSDASLWGDYLESKMTSVYLQYRGINDFTVRSNNPAAMNAAMSACRAITQDSVDLTSTGYSPSHIQYVPFFPMPLDREKP